MFSPVYLFKNEFNILLCLLVYCLPWKQSQFRFDNECNISLPENHKRVSETTAPKLDSADVPPPPDPETPSQIPEIEPPPDVASPEEDTKPAEPEEACVVVKEDATPRGRRMADEAREVAAAHASMLVDIEACKRVSMPRRLPLHSVCCVVPLVCPATLTEHSCTCHCVMSVSCPCGARVSFVSTPSATRRCPPWRSAWTATATSFTIRRRTSMT